MDFLTIFKEPDGKWSFTRISGFLLLLYYILSAAYITIKTLKIPDLPLNQMILIAALYGINKTILSIKKVAKNVSAQLNK